MQYVNLKNKWGIMWALCLPVSVACIDVMAVSVSISNIMQSFSVPLHDAQWLLSAYTVGTAAFLMLIGRLADVFGKRRVLLFGITLFFISSLAAAFSFNIIFLLLCRFVQGVASAVLMTTVVAIITHVFPVDKRPAVIARWGMSLGLGLAIGPLVGGLLVHYLNWRAIFFLNVPVSILSAWLAYRFIPECRAEKKMHLSWLESGLLAVVMLAFVFLLSELPFMYEHSRFFVDLLFFFFLASLGLILAMKRSSKPIVNIDLFFSPNYFGACFCGFLSYFCMYAWLFVFAYYLHHVVHMTALLTGLMCAMFSVAFAFSSYFLGKLMIKINKKTLMQGGFLLGVAAFLGMSLFSSWGNLWFLAVMFFLLGAAITMINAPSVAIANEFIPANQAGVASGMMFTIRWLGGTVGVILISQIYNLFLSSLLAACLFLVGVSLIGLVSSTWFVKGGS